MSDAQTFRERTPIIAKMVDRGFNGDRDADEHIAFVLVACGPDAEDGDGRVLSVTTNCSELHLMVSMLLTAISEARDNPPQRVEIGHA